MRIKLLGISLSFAVLTLFFTLSATARMADVSQSHESYNTKTADSASLPSQSMDFVGHVGGTARALDKQGERLYVGIGPRLHIIDVSNPATPITLGKTDVFLGLITAVRVSGDYAYMVVDPSRAYHSPQLHVYNIADPLHPVEVVIIEEIVEFVLVDNLLYTLSRGWNALTYLKVFDVTTSVQPLEVGNYALSGVYNAMAVDGNYVYLVSGFGSTGGMWVIDVTDFNSIEEVAFLPIDAGCFDVAVSGDYAYIANGHFGLTRIDVSDPTTPVEVVWWGEQVIAYALDVTDTRLYATGYRLGIYNIEDSAPPANVGMYAYDSNSSSSASADIVVDGGYVYVTTGAAGVHIVDIADVARAYRVGSLASNGVTNHGRDIYVMGDYAYIPDPIPVVSSSLRIIDVADPSNPVDLGNHYEFKCVYDVVAQNTVAFLTSCNKIYAVDVTDPAHPLELGSTDIVSNASGIDISGNYVYVTEEDFGLRIIDVTDPTNLQEVGSLNLSEDITGVTVIGDIAYISSGSGLYIVDVSVPQNPVELNLMPETYGGRLTIANNFVYVWRWQNDLDIFDVTDPYNPSLVSTSSHPDVSGIIDVALENETLFLSNYYFSTYMIDVSDPMSPYLLDMYYSQSTPGNIDVVGNYAYLYQWNESMDILYVGGLKIPEGVGRLDTPIDGREVAVVGDFAYVTDNYGIPNVIDIADPAAPAVVSTTSVLPSVRDMVISGTYLYVVKDGLHVFDVTDLNDPQPIATFGYDGDEMVIKDDLAYIGGSGLEIVDISDPHNPNRIGSARFFRDVEDIAISGNYVYIVRKDRTGLQIVDVTTPTLPVKLDIISINGDFIVAAGNYIYVSVGMFIYVFDITDPRNPVEVNHIRTSAFYGLTSMELSGDFIYASANEGAFIIDISNPENPVEVDLFETSGYGWDLTLRDGLIYVADGVGGLTILSVFEPVSAAIPPAGGILTSTIDGTSYIFPAGAFTDTVIVTHAYRFPESVLAPPVDLMGIDHFFEITAVYSNTNQPAELAPGMTYTVTIQYDDTEVGAAIEDTLSLYYQGNEEWQSDFVDSYLDTEANRLVTTLDHFSVWGVMGETNHIFLPIVANN